MINLRFLSEEIMDRIIKYKSDETKRNLLVESQCIVYELSEGVICFKNYYPPIFVIHLDTKSGLLKMICHTVVYEFMSANNQQEYISIIIEEPFDLHFRELQNDGSISKIYSSGLVSKYFEELITVHPFIKISRCPKIKFEHYKSSFVFEFDYANQNINVLYPRTPIEIYEISSINSKQEMLQFIKEHQIESINFNKKMSELLKYMALKDRNFEYISSWKIKFKNEVHKFNIGKGMFKGQWAYECEFNNKIIRSVVSMERMFEKVFNLFDIL